MKLLKIIVPMVFALSIGLVDVPVSAAETGRTPAAALLGVKDFGAVGDGVALDTAAIQKAIDTGESKGGGIVRFPSGKYLIGTIHLKSHVTLDLDKEAVLLGSPRQEDYPEVGAMRNGLGVLKNRVLISGRNVQDVGISGQGLIDGQAESFRSKPQEQKPFLVRFQDCEGVKISGVTLARSAAWHCHLWGSSNVTIEGITILKSTLGGTDGIDIDASSDVTISNCHITSSDDAICFKSTRNKPCRRVTVTGCTIDTDWNGFKMGTESVGDFEDITMRDCVFEHCNSGGIRIYSVDGANIRNILVENITVKSGNLPVYIRLGARLKAFTEGDQPRASVGTISNVVLRNINGKTHGQGTIFITGIPGHPVRGVRIENLDLTISGGDNGQKLDIPMVEKEKSYPEPYTIFGPLPAYGIVLRHVEDCTFSKLTVVCGRPDFRHAVACLDVKNIRIDNALFKNSAPNPAPELWVKDSPTNAVQWIGTAISK